MGSDRRTTGGADLRLAVRSGLYLAVAEPIVPDTSFRAKQLISGQNC